MLITILTLFPEMFDGPFSYSIIKRAIDKKHVKLNIVNLRTYTTDRHHTVDGKPYGGGAGMILRVDIVDRAISITIKKSKIPKKDSKVILLTPKGKLFTQEIAYTLSNYQHLILIAGHYEGFDERIVKFTDEQISIGDYVLSGGELPAMIITDTILRLIPGVVGNKQSLIDESFSKQNKLEYPQYTKPNNYKGDIVPSVLMSGNHAEIKKWRDKKRITKTKLHKI